MGDIYCLVCTGAEIESYLCSGDCSSCDHYETRKCFKVAAEDADEVERVKDLLRHLREPITECNQLPKLTAEVFDRPDCPEWAKYAAVDECGSVRLFSDAPWLGASCWNWSNGEVMQLFGVKFDASDWQKSRIKRPAKKPELPEWCKVGAIGFDEEYFKIIKINDTSCDVQYLDPHVQDEDGNIGGITFYCLTKCHEANLRPLNAKEMKALVGRTVDSDYGTFLVTKFYPTVEGGEVCVDSIYYDADELLDEFTFDGKPCGVLEHKNEKGVWVS